MNERPWLLEKLDELRNDGELTNYALHYHTRTFAAEQELDPNKVLHAALRYLALGAFEVQNARK